MNYYAAVVAPFGSGHIETKAQIASALALTIHNAGYVCVYRSQYAYEVQVVSEREMFVHVCLLVIEGDKLTLYTRKTWDTNPSWDLNDPTMFDDLMKALVRLRDEALDRAYRC